MRLVLAALLGTTSLALLAGCGGSSSEPPPQTQLDPRCPSTASVVPTVPPGRHASESPRQALDDALGHKAFGVHRPKSNDGYWQEESAGPSDVVYFVHYVIRRPDYEVRVGKTSGGWFYAGEGKCVTSPFKR